MASQLCDTNKNKTEIKTAAYDCVYKTPVHAMRILLLFMFAISRHGPHKEPTRGRGDVKMRFEVDVEKGGGEHITAGGTALESKQCADRGSEPGQSEANQPSSHHERSAIAVAAQPSVDATPQAQRDAPIPPP